MLMYSCGVQIARQEFQKLSSRILSLSHAPKDTEVATGVNVVVQSESMLGSRCNTE